MYSTYNFSPQIYSLMLCSQADRDSLTGSWSIKPFSHLGVYSLPSALNMFLFANIMAPAGDYVLQFRMFHTEDTEAAQLTPPLNITVMPNKNLEYVAKVAITVNNNGLYLVEASLQGYHAIHSPLRITTLGATGR